MKINIGTYIIDVKTAAKALIFIFITTAAVILLYNFIIHGIDWVGFVEFIVSCLLLIFLVEKINIKVPGLFEIQAELSEIKRGMSVVAKNMSNIKISNRFTAVTPTYYEGPPIDVDSATGTLYTGTIEDPTEEIEINEE